MGSLPMQRDTGTRSTLVYTAGVGVCPVARITLPGTLVTPSAARRFARGVLGDWAGLGLLGVCALCQGGDGCPPGGHSTDRFVDDVVLVVDELVTNAVVHAGTGAELLCRFEESTVQAPAAVVVEVCDHHPARAVHSEPHSADQSGTPDYGRGLHLVGALAERWGITYHAAQKTVWARVPVDGWDTRSLAVAEPVSHRRTGSPPPGPAAGDERDWDGRGALSFLAEASDLLAGQLDEDMVVALAGQLLVPRLADWCAVWLDGESGQHTAGKGGTGTAPRTVRVWHSDESRSEELREMLGRRPSPLPGDARGGPVPIAWPADGEPGSGDGSGGDGTALACPLVAGGRSLGRLLVARQGLAPVPDDVAALVEDFARRVALAISAARQYTRQATISQVLQRGLLPSKVGQIPGVDSFLVYEPSDDGVVGGDFYDIFPAGSGARWCFVLGDVQGSGPEAAVVTGLARPWLRLLAREGYQVAQVLDRLNGLLLDDATEAAESAAALVAAASAGGQGVPEGPQARFLSLLYGEVVASPAGGVRCTLASAGHPLPLLLRPDGTVRAAAEPQMLLGVVDDVTYESQTFDLEPGDTLLCVTDGVTERRSGARMFDDEDGLATVLAGCTGLPAQGVAQRIREAVYAFAEAPPRDDLALLVLQAR
ncbi:SpoIIE family protein phosphatase [Streptomyces sp. NPDC058572]|uniref:SpoIIE family protein phosphatase n=1 Tax=Streptomyces sp. NPDC058572 TaxID=3346546 RepID=UPI003669A9A8